MFNSRFSILIGGTGRKSMTFSRYFLFLALIGTFAVHPGWSQGTSTLSGNVTDTTGAVIPGTEVTITNLATSATRTATTNEVGAYVFPQVPPGTYKVDFKKEGFSSVVRD